jgi:hypothetical protein
LVDDALGVGGHLTERALAVEVLTAGEEPDFERGDVVHDGFGMGIKSDE